LDALFVADHPEGFAAVQLDNTPTTYTADQLVQRFAPVLLFDDGTSAGASGGAERYRQAYAADMIFNHQDLFNGNDTGATDQEMNLSAFATNYTFTSGAAIYGTVLKKSDLVSRGMLPNDGQPDEVAINYWFHYPRSNWGEHGGFNTHEGDWEGVTVFLRKDPTDTFFTPHRVAFGQHTKLFFGVAGGLLHTDGGETVFWNAIDTDDSFRPNVYVGLGGHASYYDSGPTSYLTGPEFHSGALIPSYDARLNNEVVTLLHVGDVFAEDWARFPGHWGRLNIESTLLNEDDGPLGPVFLSGGFPHGLRWLNPWAWSEGFSEVEGVNAASLMGDMALNGTIMEFNATGTDASATWNNVQLSSLSTGVQFDFHFTQPGDGDILEVLVNGIVVGSLLGTDNVTSDFAISPMFDISAFTGQTVDLQVRFRSVGPVAAEVLVENVSIVNPDYADLLVDAAAYTPDTYLRLAPLPLNVTVRNQGTFDEIASQTFDLTVYLSTDNVWDAGDRAIHTQTIDDVLPAGDTDLYSLNTAIPGDMPVGNYYLILRVDTNSEILEMNENNNVFVSSAADVGVILDPAVSLPVINLSANPATITSGAATTLSWTVQDAASCMASGGWSGAKNVQGGSQVFSPSVGETYGLDCTGPGLSVGRRVSDRGRRRTISVFWSMTGLVSAMKK
jgi:hypothetical protein